MAAQRKKIGTEEIVVPVGLVTVLVSFNNMRAGDQAVTDINDRLRAYEAAGLVRIQHIEDVPLELTLEVKGGEDQAGPGAAEPDSAGGKPTEG